MIPSELQQLRAEYLRLTLCKDLQSCKDMLSIYSQYLLSVITNHQLESVDKASEIEAKLVTQMMLTKVLHIRSAIEGVSLTGETDVTLNSIIDPTVIVCLVRNVFETVGMFNLVYLCPKSEDEHTVLYFLWKMAGLKFRQRFKNNITTAENEQKFDKEQDAIDEMKNLIEATDLYINLEEKYQKMIANKIKDRDYRIRFEGGKVSFVDWKDIPTIFGVRPGLMDQMYTYFSLYAHPSNVAVFQFGEMFNKTNPAYLWITVSNLKNLFGLVSIFIADYIRLFPNVIKTFEQLPLINQLVIDGLNATLRTRQFSINKSWEVLG